MHRYGVVLLAGLLSALAASAAPRLEVSTQEIDLGALAKGDAAEARFEFRNTGDEILRILEAKPG